MLAIPRCFGDTAPSGSSAAGTSAAPAAGDDVTELPRNPELEAYLDDLATRAAGLTHDSGLARFANERAHDGGIRLYPGRRLPVDAAEEAADWRNYLEFRITQLWPRVQDGDEDAADEFAGMMEALRHVFAGYAAMKPWLPH